MGNVNSFENALTENIIKEKRIISILKFFSYRFLRLTSYYQQNPIHTQIYLSGLRMQMKNNLVEVDI